MKGGALACLALLLAGAATAGGVRDLDDAWLAEGRDTAAWLAGETRGAGGSWLEVAHGRLYGLPELPQLGCRVLRATGGWTLDLGYERLGADLYREQRVRGALLREGTWRGGVAVEQRRLALGGEPAGDHIAVTVRAEGPLVSAIRLGVDWPLGSEPPWYGERGLRRWLRLEVVGTVGSWIVALDRRADGTPSLQTEGTLRLAPNLACSGRFDAASGALGMGTFWLFGRLLVRTAHLAHPELGATHRLSLGVRR